LPDRSAIDRWRLASRLLGEAGEDDSDYRRPTCPAVSIELGRSAHVGTFARTAVAPAAPEPACARRTRAPSNLRKWVPFMTWLTDCSTRGCAPNTARLRIGVHIVRRLFARFSALGDRGGVSPQCSASDAARGSCPSSALSRSPHRSWIRRGLWRYRICICSGGLACHRFVGGATTLE